MEARTRQTAQLPTCDVQHVHAVVVGEQDVPSVRRQPEHMSDERASSDLARPSRDGIAHADAVPRGRGVPAIRRTAEKQNPLSVRCPLKPAGVASAFAFRDPAHAAALDVEDPDAVCPVVSQRLLHGDPASVGTPRPVLSDPCGRKPPQPGSVGADDVDRDVAMVVDLPLECDPPSVRRPRGGSPVLG